MLILSKIKDEGRIIFAWDMHADGPVVYILQKHPSDFNNFSK